jgi:transcriptional regulator with XRE-family HTH domain
MDSQGIGRRVAYWRNRRRMTQQEFGMLMGQTRRWVQDLEGGHRQRDPRLSVLENAARVLQIRLEVLLSDTAGAQCIDAVELESIRAVLLRHDVITGTAEATPGPDEPVPIEDLRRHLAYARTTFQTGRFASLGSLVPELLAKASHATAQHQNEAQRDAFRVLSLTLELTEAAAIKFGDTDLAMAAGYRAVVAAERSEDPVSMASAARHLADAMTSHGQAQAAAAFAVASAERLGTDLRRRGPDGYSVLGMLWLKAAMAQATAAAVADDARTADPVPAFLDQADEHAAELGRDDNRVWTVFGPTNVALHRVAAHVQLSQGAEAVAVALGIPEPALAGLPRERRAHHLADLARACMQAGRREDAVNELLKAEAEAKEEVLCRPRTKQLVEDLRLSGAGSAEGRLQALAGRCGLPT